MPPFSLCFFSPGRVSVSLVTADPLHGVCSLPPLLPGTRCVCARYSLGLSAKPRLMFHFFILSPPFLLQRYSRVIPVLKVLKMRLAEQPGLAPSASQPWAGGWSSPVPSDLNYALIRTLLLLPSKKLGFPRLSTSVSACFLQLNIISGSARFQTPQLAFWSTFHLWWRSLFPASYITTASFVLPFFPVPLSDRRHYCHLANSVLLEVFSWFPSPRATVQLLKTGQPCTHLSEHFSCL